MRTASTLLLAAGAAAAVPAPAQAATYDIDTSHSRAGFAVKHMVVSTVRGAFDKVTGTIELDEKDPTRSRIEATIDAATIATGDAKRDAHLKSADFFDVAKYPTLTFRSRKIARAAAGGGLRVTGDLTMHGVTREVTLDVEPLSAEVKDPWGGLRRGTTATTRIQRKDFGLSWNMALEAGGLVVGEEVQITLDVELIRKAASAPAKPASR